jgi:hypothetical protein
MPNCIICGSYSRFPNGKCYNCYKKNNNNIDTLYEEVEEDFLEDKGLNDKEWNYRFGMIKGRIAETLIQELFLSLGYNVFHYGMENTIPGIMDLLKGVKSDVAKQIKRMPDFVIQHPDSKSVFFLEVKFRAKGSFKYSDLKPDYPYENAYVILVSKKHIKCLSVTDLKNGKEITPECRNYLGNVKAFELDKEIIKDFCEFALKFFANV